MGRAQGRLLNRRTFLLVSLQPASNCTRLEATIIGGLTLVLAPYPPDTEPRVPVVYRDGIYEHGYGVGHFGLHVENVDESVETVRERGAKILAEPREFVGARFA